MNDMGKWYQKLLKALLIISVGGCLYVTIEVFFRSRSHWSMFIVGGLSFYLIGLLNEHISWDFSLVLQAILGSCIITALEFVSGCIVNLWLQWNVWDYSHMPMNVLGQICLPFSLVWILLSMIAILFDDILRWKLFGERIHRYKFF